MRGARRHPFRAVALLLIAGCAADPQSLEGRDGGVAVSDVGAILADGSERDAWADSGRRFDAATPDTGGRDAGADSGSMSDAATTDAREHPCEPDEPVGPLPAMDCDGPELRDDLPIVCADVEPCSEAGDCIVVIVDACCGLTRIAILATRADEVSDAVGECLDHPAPTCPTCPPREAAAACWDGRCRIIGRR